MLFLYCTTAPKPPSVTTKVVDVTSITLQWDPLPCRDRNGEHFNHYRIFYFSTVALDQGNVDVVLENDKQFTLSRLPPRTSYEFLAQAVNLATSLYGEFAAFRVSTSAPSSKLLLLKCSVIFNYSGYINRLWFSPEWSAVS